MFCISASFTVVKQTSLSLNVQADVLNILIRKIFVRILPMLCRRRKVVSVLVLLDANSFSWSSSGRNKGNPAISGLRTEHIAQGWVTHLCAMCSVRFCVGHCGIVIHPGIVSRITHNLLSHAYSPSFSLFLYGIDIKRLSIRNSRHLLLVKNLVFFQNVRNGYYLNHCYIRSADYFTSVVVVVEISHFS